MVYGNSGGQGKLQLANEGERAHDQELMSWQSDGGRGATDREGMKLAGGSGDEERTEYHKENDRPNKDI
jgi:hypothetical protein